jgi:hypothetical protein
VASLRHYYRKANIHDREPSENASLVDIARLIRSPSMTGWKSWGPLPRLDRILCVVRELTDDSRRGVGGTAHKINWMKEHDRGGRRLQKPQCGTVYAIWELYPTALSTRQAYAYPCFPSMTVCGQQATALLLSNAAHQRIPRSITSSVSSKLSRSDFVQWGILGNLCKAVVSIGHSWNSMRSLHYKLSLFLP